jgi:hypothetical protein
LTIISQKYQSKIWGSGNKQFRKHGIVYDESDTTLNKWSESKTKNKKEMESIESWNIFNDLFSK